MRALVVYESMFGNTRAVAEAVAEALSPELTVEVLDVAHAPAPIETLVDLVVVGGPTHAFSLSKPATRANAVEQGAPEAATDTGLREWLHRLHKGPHSEVVACFDTRSEKVRHLPGSAAHKAASLLKHLGYHPVSSQSFYVSGTAGPLLPGELDRARAWGRTLAADLAAAAVGR